jgi:hypothetical protein
LGGEFGKEGQVALLPGGEGGAGFGDGCHQSFVICEESERTTFKGEAEMA